MAEKLAQLKKAESGGSVNLPFYVFCRGGNGASKLVYFNFDTSTLQVTYSSGNNFSNDDVSYTGGQTSIKFKKAGYYFNNGGGTTSTLMQCTANQTVDISSSNTRALVFYEGLVNPFE